MGYNFDVMSQQLQDLQRQYQQLQGYPQQSQNMFQPVSQVSTPMPSRQVQYVDGIEGARIYQQNLPSNSSEIIMDKEDNIFYYVSKDANGTPSKRIPIGHFTIEDTLVDEPTFLTRKDFDDFKEEIRQMFAQTQTTTPKTSTTTSIKKNEGGTTK